MELDDKKTKDTKADYIINGLVKELQLQLSENLTMLNLSHRKIADFDETVVLPPQLINLDLSHNHLRYIPAAVLNLANIKTLDLSHNNIKYFDDTPNFCQTIEELNLSHNSLEGPPYWIWSESPSNMVKINLSCNMNFTYALTDDYVEELLQYKTLVNNVKISNCTLRNHLEFFGTFPQAKSLEIGSTNLGTFWSNHLTSIPCKGLDQCLEIEKLNLSNTQIYSIESNIDIYKNLVEINLSYNSISSLPNTFCQLYNLATCILSHNNILYLPEDIVELKKLECLKLDSNELCMLPENLHCLLNLRVLDLYDNSLYEVADEILSIQELDVAQNYFEEPDDEDYLKKKEKLRRNSLQRNDGRKHEVSQPEIEWSPDTTDDEELIRHMENCELNDQQDHNDPDKNRSSSPEDWDSDEYWVPRYYQRDKSTQSPWLHYVKQKMQEGNFCPMDLHPVPVSEKIKYDNLCNPKIWPVVEGQFDDLSDEES